MTTQSQLKFRFPVCPVRKHKPLRQTTGSLDDSSSSLLIFLRFCFLLVSFSYWQEEMVSERYIHACLHTKVCCERLSQKDRYLLLCVRGTGGAPTCFWPICQKETPWGWHKIPACLTGAVFRAQHCASCLPFPWPACEQHFSQTRLPGLFRSHRP